MNRYTSRISFLQIQSSSSKVHHLHQLSIHISPDGSMIAFVRECELHVLYALSNEQGQLTSGAAENVMVRLTENRCVLPYSFWQLILWILMLLFYVLQDSWLAEYIAQVGISSYMSLTKIFSM
ncbi:hypothetical protein SAY87_007014 [Trapa incisa]|uniref:Uncharacterized protein n=1 Tax=Trapa incisa TaxID=236973 RepID=A0AAN7PZI5_9MYRT|nr:hypothetical protein SAY87_007014 [Trapa incisa]